jgi:peptide/nickel transport system permease protein
MLMLLKRLLRSVAVLFVVCFVTFCLMYGNGPGIARRVAGVQATEEDVQRELVDLGLDRPLLEQFWSWLTNALSGDLGRSFYTGQPVTDALSTRIPVTLSLVLVTIAITSVIAVLAGMAAAVHGGWIDRAVQFLAVLGAAIPPFIVAIAVVFTFAIKYRLFPATGYAPLSDGLGPWLESITLPVIALLIGSVAAAASQFRGALIDTMSRDFVRTLVARGVNRPAVLFRHVLRNSAAPGLTVLSLQLLALLGGAIFVEQVFALPGLGQLANTSAQLGDVPMVMGTVVVAVLFVLAINFVADLTIVVVNPKARTR